MSPDEVGPAPTGLVRLTVTATVPGLAIEISARRDRRFELACTTPCAVHVRPGVYTFRVPRTSDTVAGSRTLTLDRDTAVELDPDTWTHLHLGLGFIGLSAILAAAAGASAEDREFPLLLAAAALVPGVILTTTAFKPEFTRTDSGVRQARTPRPPLSGAPAAPRSGARLALGWSVHF